MRKKINEIHELGHRSCSTGSLGRWEIHSNGCSEWGFIIRITPKNVTMIHRLDFDRYFYLKHKHRKITKNIRYITVPRARFVELNRTFKYETASYDNECIDKNFR